MFTYEIADRMLTLRLDGLPTPAERTRVFQEIRTDVRVPDDALVLIDARRLPIQAVDGSAAFARLERLVTLLGPKLGPVCAILSTVGAIRDEPVRQAASALALRVAVFDDEATARQWLVDLP